MTLASSTIERWVAALYVIAFASVVALAATSVGLWQQTRTLAGDEIVALGGYGYVIVYPVERAPLSMFAHLTDGNDAPTASGLKLFENGRAIGAPHADHASVREKGLGRYSDWTASAGANELVFSTSDNSDPRTNGRTYSIAYPLEPAPLAQLLTALFCGGAAAVFLVRNRAAMVHWLRRAVQTGAARNAFIAVSYVISAIVLLTSFGLWRHTDRIDSASISPIGGNAYSAQLPSQLLALSILGRQPDSGNSPRKSDLALFENGRPLGPPHTPHATIRDGGRGAYSHWGGPSGPDAVIFSTPDNTSPLTNERQYSIAYPLQPGWATQFVALVLAITATIALYRADVGRRRLGAVLTSLLHGRIWLAPVVGAATYVVAFYAWRLPAVPLLQHDSVDYLTGLPTVPLGYLGFAKLVSVATGNLAALPACQISIWAASVLALYFALARTLHLRAVAGLTCVALLLLGTATKYAMFALTESLFMSTMILHVAGVLLVFERPTRTRLLVVGVTAFLAGFLRPAGYFVPLCTIGLVALVPTFKRRVLQFAVGPMLSLFLLAGTVGHVSRGEPSQSLLGFALFPYVAPLFDPNDVAPELRGDATAVERAISDYRVEWSTQQTRAERIHFEMDNFNSVSRRAEGALLDRGIEQNQINDYFATFAFATLRTRPFAYAVQVSDHASYAWSMLFYPIDTRAWLNDNYRRYESDHNEFADAIRPRIAPKYRYEDLRSGARTLESDSAAFDFVPNALASIPYLGEGLGLASALIILISVAFPRRFRGLAPALYVAVMMHAAIVLVAATTIVIWRYVDVIVPLALVLIAVLLDRTVQYAKTARSPLIRRAGPPPPANALRIVVINAALLCALLMFAGLAAEAWLRTSKPTSTATAMFVSDPELGWDSKPSVQPVALVDGARAILFIGDSFTHATRWSGMTIEALRTHGFAYDGYSLGVGGYGTIQAYLKLRRHLERYHPAFVVLLFFAWNDMRDNFDAPGIYYSPETRVRPYYRDDQIRLRERVLPQWITTSELYARLVVARAQADTERQKHERGATWLRDTGEAVTVYYTDVDTWSPFYLRDRQSDRYVAGAWRDTEHALADLKRFVEEHGSRLLLVGIDNAFTVDDDVYRQWAQGIEGFDPTLPLERLGEIARRHEIEYLDCLPGLRRLHGQLGRKVYNGPEGNLSGHLEPEGERLIAQRVSDRIAAQHVGQR